MPLANRKPTNPPAARPGAGRTAAGQSFVLDIPFEARPLAKEHGVLWDASRRTFVYRGSALPEALGVYRAQPYSWERLQEDELNDRPLVPSTPTSTITLRAHQKEAVAAIAAARKAGRTGFLNADDVGLGKTIETWAAILAMPDIETVLIVCPLAVVAHWRRTILSMGDGGKRIVVINYDRLKKLFEVPAEIAAKAGARRKKRGSRKVRTAKGVARYGQAYEFDLVVWDEAHKLRNPEAARTKLSLALNAEADFLMWLSATAGQNPLELSYLAPLLAETTGGRARDLKDFEAWCKDQGLGVERGAFGRWSWRGAGDDEAARIAARADLERMRALLFGGRVPAGIRRSPTDIAGWPEINRILLPVALDAQDRALYGRIWDEFRHAVGLERRGSGNERNALTARLRLRQKSSLLRTAATVDLAADLLEQGLQVAVSCAFHDTLEVVRDGLSASGHEVVEIHGKLSGPAKEAQRLAFQKGDARVCVYTVEDGISLHQGEYNDTPRANIVHDLRWSGIQMKQIEGRTHRDGRFSQVYWMLGEGTVEEDVAQIVSTRMSEMAAMHGDTATVNDIERMLMDRIAA